ncbi:MAG: peptidoglycan DD-metalloendopeptidase family protein [candidate division WOR-3 bacterium]|nr:peptidoglycan DD-metalloendopeptidase family protein [candidate division WOR-3 bacterium]
MFWCLIFLTLFSSGVQSPEERLETLRKKLKEQREKISQLKEEKTGILRNLEELDKEISLNRKLVEELRRKIEITGEEIKNIELLRGELDYRLREKRQILKKRMKEIYIHGSLHPLEVVLLSYSFSDALKRIKFLSLIADQDKKVLDEIMQLEERLNLKKSQVERKLSLLDKIYNELENQEEELSVTKNGKRKYLTEIESKRKNAIKMSEEMKQSMKDLEDLISKLSTKEKTEGSIYFEKKQLKLPVDGFIISYFGRRREKRYGTITINRGIDIRADWGTDIKAVAPGRVVYSDNFLGYGKIILIEHGEGFISLYSHLSTITVENGNEVTEGTVIGKVGETGSAKEPTLHFEIRKSGKAINPMNYIKL